MPPILLGDREHIGPFLLADTDEHHSAHNPTEAHALNGTNSLPPIRSRKLGQYRSRTLAVSRFRASIAVAGFELRHRTQVDHVVTATFVHVFDHDSQFAIALLYPQR